MAGEIVGSVEMLRGLVAFDTTSRNSNLALIEYVQQYLVDEAWFAPVAFSPVFYYARPDLGGLSVTATAPTADPLDWYDTE